LTLKYVNLRFSQKSYEVETILAMLLWNAREQTQAFADQPVKDVVITIPAYFNQAERVGVAAAAKIAGLNLLSVNKFFDLNAFFTVDV
jgi:hypoxia up-regulated 1